MIQDNIRRSESKNKSEIRFALRGEFDIWNRPQLARALEAGISYPVVTVDLEKATFIDASTLGAFAQLARRRRELNWPQPRIVNVNDRFRKIFSICELEQIVSIDEGLAHR